MQPVRSFALVVFIVVALAMAACGQTTAPVAAPAQSQAPIITPTQTRAAELAQVATLTVPTATAVTTSTPNPPTATIVPTATSQPPTATPVPPTSTVLPTATLIPPTATPDYVAIHTRYFADQQRIVKKGTSVADVTGDSTPEFLYMTTEVGGCNRGSGGISYCYDMATVFGGGTAIFDSGTSEPRRYREGSTITALPSGAGFQVFESATPNIGATTWTYQWRGGTFALADKVTASLPTATPSAKGSVSNYPTSTPNKVGSDTPRGVLMSQNWQWEGMPMPAGVYLTGQNSARVGFYMDATEDAIVGWFANNWSSTGYRFTTGMVGNNKDGWRTYFFCQPNRKECYEVGILPANRNPAASTSPYPGYTFVVVQK